MRFAVYFDRRHPIGQKPLLFKTDIIAIKSKEETKNKITVETSIEAAITCYKGGTKGGEHAIC